MMRRHKKPPSLSNSMRFRATFGASPEISSEIWNMIDDEEDYELPRLAKPKHLLWGLMFLKMYCSEAVHCIIAGGDDGPVHEQTFRKWSWCFVELISILQDRVIVWDNRLRGDVGKQCKVTVDGTDFKIFEPAPFSSKWVSHKFQGPGLRYEVAVSIQSGDIVWINGPYQCGLYPDLTIFRRGLIYMLEGGEKVEADKGYAGERLYANTPTPGIFDSGGIARSRHETVNKRFKQWGCLGHRFRHCFTKHHSVFSAVAVITQLLIESGEKLFAVNYDGDAEWYVD